MMPVFAMDNMFVINLIPSTKLLDNIRLFLLVVWSTTIQQLEYNPHYISF